MLDRALRLRSTTVSTSSSPNEPSTPSRATPALLTSTSIAPKRSTTSLHERARRLAVDEVDRLEVGSGRPARRRPTTPRSVGVDERLHVATRSPSSRNAWTRPAPRPRLPPVTMTVRGSAHRSPGAAAGRSCSRRDRARRRSGCGGAGRGRRERSQAARIASSSSSVSTPARATTSTATIWPVIGLGRP